MPQDLSEEVRKYRLWKQKHPDLPVPLIPAGAHHHSQPHLRGAMRDGGSWHAGFLRGNWATGFARIRGVCARWFERRALRRGHGNRKIVGLMTNSEAWGAMADTGDYCHRWAKWSESALRQLAVETAEELQQQAEADWPWKERHANLVDGSTLPWQRSCCAEHAHAECGAWHPWGYEQIEPSVIR